ncbi:AraC family transcriptional regulator [Aquimarina sp. I32.4]|uniref:AraC family transcriptional regulator n=1 Tax=Aquimarina sp. I32.4 TaxID=2053903 RepID=UPI001304F7AA|nr:AraC family transcriptional regulator [Aquimarina sp. I32.4]
MKPILINKKNTSLQESLLIDIKMYRQIYSLWHYHQELEILYITNHKGTAFVGDRVFSFNKSTLIFLGSNLPHMFKPDKSYRIAPNDGMEAFLLHFPINFITSIIQNTPEFNIVKKLLKKAERGIFFENKKKNREIAMVMQNISENKNYDRILHFFKLLKLLAEDNEHHLIASEGYTNSLTLPISRFDKIYEYTMLNFNDPEISLESVANSVFMNKAAFCRYFKKVTQKTFFQFLNEIRISYACKFLHENNIEQNISDIAFLSGYNTISNFNKQFKKIMNISPTEYVNIRKGNPKI